MLVSRARRILSVGATLVLAGLSPATTASEWQVVAADSDSAFLVDRRSVAQDGAFVTVWSLTRYTDPQRMPRDPDAIYRSLRMLWTIDCPGRAAAASRLVAHPDADGSGSPVFDRAREISEDDLRPVLTGSRGEDLLGVACGVAEGQARRLPV
jgi:hypothetical protein